MVAADINRSSAAGFVKQKPWERIYSSSKRLWILGWVGCLLLLIFTSTAQAAIDFWHPWPQADRTVRYLAGIYQRERGVTVRVRSYNPSHYHPWTGKSSPDVIGLYQPTKTGISSLAASGRIYDLQPQMIRGWYGRFYPGFLETFIVRKLGKTAIYGVPLTGQVYMIVYNRQLFRKAGVRTPIYTWRDLMIASQRLRRIGVVPYAGGFSSSRPPLAHAYEWSYLGLHDLTRTYFGYYPYTSVQWVSYLNLYAEMRQNGFTDSRWAALSETSAMKYLLNGRVAMIFVGPSFNTVRRAYKPQFRDWGLLRMPVDHRARFLPRLPGGVAEGIVINKRSKQKTAAIQFAMWLTDPRQQVILANGAYEIPATASASMSRQLRPDIRLFVSGMSDQSVDLRISERSAVLRALYGGAMNVLRGRATPSAVAARVQRVKRR